MGRAIGSLHAPQGRAKRHIRRWRSSLAAWENIWPAIAPLLLFLQNLHAPRRQRYPLRPLGLRPLGCGSQEITGVL